MIRYLPTGLLCLSAILAWPCVKAADRGFDIQALDVAVPDQSTQSVTSGALDAQFKAQQATDISLRSGSVLWLKLRLPVRGQSDAVVTLNVRRSRQLEVQVFTKHGLGVESVPLRLATAVAGFRGTQDAVFVLPADLQAGQTLYARVAVNARGAELPSFTVSTLAETLVNTSDHARMIAMTFGALMAMALAALLIWFVLSERLLLLYASLFSLQAVYVAFLSGQGFDWPVLSAVLPLESYASKVPAGLSGAIACLFVREIAELRRFSPKVYKVFGWMAVAFVAVTVANIAQHVGLGGAVAMIGNLLFVGSGIFTLIVAFLAWRRDNRAAGWFLIAWALLETFTIATALRLLFDNPENAVALLYYGLPLSMIAAAVLIALGVADRLREQRRALTEAESRAQIDPLTGVLNRRSLADRLDAACVRAQTRGLPIALLFIDLDHFKKINDTYGHAAGDACLKAIVAPIQSELRHSDVIGRYGGEEFVVILSSADTTAAQPIAERIRNRVAETVVIGFGDPIRITCSIGVASSDTLGVWGEQLITRADEAVYQAKRSGRNRIQVAESHSMQMTA